MTSLQFIALATAFAAAQPTIAWNGAGWYQTEATSNDYRIVSGPFASKELCVAKMHADTAEADYRCYDMAVRPHWEK